MTCKVCGSNDMAAPSPGNPNAIASGNVAQNAPTNQVGPYYKEIDTIPPGEQRVVFVGLVASTALQTVFTNPKSVTIEICEMLIQSVGGNTITLFSGGVAITPPFEMADGVAYDDSGFLLSQGQPIQVLVTGAGTLNGFIRWRYQ